jgi:hypothetical protein
LQSPGSRRNEKTDEEKGKLKSFWLILASIFMWFMGYNAISSNLSVYTTKTLNLSAGVASIISGVSMGISAIAFIPVGALAAKIGRRKSIMLGFALAVISFFLIFFFVHAGEKAIVPAVAIIEMERLMRLHDDVMRVLTIKVDVHADGPSVQMQKRDERERGDRPEGGFGGGERTEEQDEGGESGQGDLDRRAGLGDTGEGQGTTAEQQGERFHRGFLVKRVWLKGTSAGPGERDPAPCPASPLV